MIESGFPGLSLGFWVGLWAPAGTPAPIVDKLNAEINAVLASPEMQAALSGSASRRDSARQDFAASSPTEMPKWQDIVRVSGVKVE